MSIDIIVFGENNEYYFRGLFWIVRDCFINHLRLFWFKLLRVIVPSFLFMLPLCYFFIKTGFVTRQTPSYQAAFLDLITYIMPGVLW